jgi:hypothetical protein
VLGVLGNAIPVDVLLDIVCSDPELLVCGLWMLLEEFLAAFLPILQITIFKQCSLQSEDVVSDHVSLTSYKMLDVGLNVNLAGIKDKISQQAPSCLIEITLAVVQ